jgi:hypothetical protein
MPAVFNVIGGFALHHATERLGRHSGSILFLQGERYKEDFVVKACGGVIDCSRGLQLWAQKQDPWLAALMASPAAPVILSRVVVFAQKRANR